MCRCSMSDVSWRSIGVTTGTGRARPPAAFAPGHAESDQPGDEHHHGDDPQAWTANPSPPKSNANSKTKKDDPMCTPIRQACVAFGR